MAKIFNKSAFLVLLLLISFISKSQETNLKSSSDYKPETTNYRSIFRSTRLINFQTVETLKKGSFDLRISHRLGTFKDPIYNFFGFDGPATIKIAFDYSLNDNLTLGVGRNSNGKLWEGFVKWRLLHQTEDGKMPISLSFFTGSNITSRPDSKANEFDKFGARFNFVYQIMLARQFGKILSLQIAPTWIHYNQVNASVDKNDQFALASMARLRLTKSFLIIGEYGLRLNKFSETSGISYHNSAAFGLEVQTSGHSFQFFVTNSGTMNESQFLTQTTSDVLKGEIRLGFNISRVFHFGKRI